MVAILADILLLIQYQQLHLNDPEKLRLERCPCCGGANPHRHGGYPRKADRTHAGESINPVIIQRYYCPTCHRTSSALPECLPPHRWYLWDIQQMAISLLLSGMSVRAVASKVMPSRRTISRWINRLQEQWLIHKDALCSHVIHLGRAAGYAEFWRNCFECFTFAKAMRLCAVAGVVIP